MMTKNNKMNLPFIEPLLDWLCTDVAWTFVCTGACDSNFEVTVLHISNILDVYIFVIKSNNSTKKKITDNFFISSKNHRWTHERNLTIQI